MLAEFVFENGGKKSDLRMLSVSSIYLDLEWAEKIATAFASNRNLEFICFPSCDLDAKSIKPIIKIIGQNPKLRVVFLNDNNIGAEGIRGVADAIKNHSAL